MDSIERGASAMVHVFAIVPCLFFCLMWVSARREGRACVKFGDSPVYAQFILH